MLALHSLLDIFIRSWPPMAYNPQCLTPYLQVIVHGWYGLHCIVHCWCNCYVHIVEGFGESWGTFQWGDIDDNSGCYCIYGLAIVWHINIELQKKKKNQFIYMYINNHIQSFTSFELKKNLQILFSFSNILTYIIINYCCKYMHLSS